MFYIVLAASREHPEDDRGATAAVSRWLPCSHLTFSTPMPEGLSQRRDQRCGGVLACFGHLPHGFGDENVGLIFPMK